MNPIVLANSEHREAAAGERIDAEFAPPYVLAAKLLSPITVANTAAGVLTLAIPANTLQVGDIIEIDGYGRYNSTATASTDKLSVTLGTGTAITNPTVTSITYGNGAVSRSNLPAFFKGMLTVRAVGTNAVIMGEIIQQRHIVPTNTPVATTTATNFNSTVNNLLGLVYQSGNSGASMTFENVVIKLWR
jgi:hypothetical protein